MLCEAVDYAADHVAAAIGRAKTGIEMLDVAVRFYREGLLETDYRAGCPVLAVAVEAGDPGAGPEPVEHAAAAFDRWRELIARRLVDDGVAGKQARELAALVLAALEGALVLARASRDVEALDAVHRQLRALLAATERNR